MRFQNKFGLELGKGCKTGSDIKPIPNLVPIHPAQRVFLAIVLRTKGVGNDTPPLALDMEENKKSEGLSIPANQDILDKLGEPEAETISINNNLPQRRSSLSDEFDSVLDLESSFEKVGFAEGLRRGICIGEAEGLCHGIMYGFDTASEIAFYWGMAAVWLSVLDSIPGLEKYIAKNRIAANLLSIKEMACTVILCDNPGVLDSDIIGRIRSKYTVLSKNLDKLSNHSTLLLTPARYNQRDGGCARSIGY